MLKKCIQAHSPLQKCDADIIAMSIAKDCDEKSLLTYHRILNAMKTRFTLGVVFIKLSITVQSVLFDQTRRSLKPTCRSPRILISLS